MASPRVDLRLPERLHARVLEAAEAEGLSLSGFVRRAILDRLDDSTREAAERAALLAEARGFLANPGEDREAASLVSRYVKALEAQAGRLSAAEARGRARALAEVADGALEPLDGQVLELRPYGLRDELELPTVLETAVPARKRGFLREALAAERARALLQAPAPPSPPPSAAGLLGEARTRELWTEATRWLGARWAFCRQHGMVPCAPSSDGRQCYLGCTIPTTPEAA